MICKNIKHLLRQYPLSLALNFIGLVCAFTAFMVVSHQVEYELSFDTCHPTADRVYRADKKADETMFRNILPRGFSDDIIASSPHIVAGCSLCPFFGDLHYTTVADNPVAFQVKTNFATSGFINVFGIDMLEGDAHALETPSGAIIPKSLADALFPGKNAEGQMLHSDAHYMLKVIPETLTITGVYRDFPSNTQLENIIYVSAGHIQEGSYGGANFICYVLLDDAANRAAVEKNFNDSYDFARFEDWLTPIELIKLTDIYFRNEGDVYKSGSYSQFILLIAIAVLILLTGMINFTNFYIALTPLRMKSVNTRMVFGASKTALQGEVVGESLVWSLLALVLALLLFNPVCKALNVNGLTPDTFRLGSSPMLLLGTILAAGVTGAFAGILPGIYSTSLQPALALKGSFGLSKSGRLMRTTLVYVQLVISFILLIYVFSIERQSNYMKDYPCGYDKEHLAVVNIGNKNYAKQHNWLRESLRAIPGVEDVAFASEFIGSSDTYNTSSFDFGQGETMLSMISCTPNFPALIELEVVEGDGFTDSSDDVNLLTKNLKGVGAELGNYDKGLHVGGFVNTINITSLRKAESYVSFRAVKEDEEYLPCVYIKFADHADRAAITLNIRKVLKEMDAVQTYDVFCYDDLPGVLYSGEERLRKEIWIFSMLAILLSLVGIWGQTLMDVKYRRKEISVKRVLGASQSQVIAEGMRHYAAMVGICFVVASPFAYLATQRYLSQFARQAGISPLAFLFSLLIVLALSMAIVVFHYGVCLRTNPADVLKHE